MASVHPTGRAFRRLPMAACAGLVAFAFVAPSAVADDVAPQVLVVEGTLVNVVIEPEPGVAHVDAELEIATFIEVDGGLYPVPEEVPVEAAATGTSVEVTIAAEAGMSPEEALDAATADVAAPGDAAPLTEAAEVALEEAATDAGTEADEHAPATEAQATELAAPEPEPAPEGEAQVLAVTTTGATPDEPLAAAAAGNHTLTVLPVYWTSPDGTSKGTLDGLARQTAQFWAEQSSGRVSTSVSTRDWVRIADPGGCATDTIMERALAAHGIGSLSTNQHVLVYFPREGACGSWAGLASVGGGLIWINGYPLLDVFAHEFGHNLGLGHANTMTCRSGSTRVPLSSSCTVSEYGDYADVMGIGMSGRPTGNLNTALAHHLGFANVVRPSAATTVDLAPLSSYGATRGIAIPVSQGTVYIDYRPAAGRDVRRPEWGGVQVHLQRIDPVFRYATSYLLDMTAPATGEFTSPAAPVGSSWTVPGTAFTMTVAGTGSSARVQLTTGTGSLSPGSAAIQRYVSRVYRDLFNRGVDASGLNTWTTALQTGTPRIAVANSITSSTEYRSRLITGSYRTYLNRGPDGPGLQHWLSMMARGMTIQEMEAGFISSDEYYLKAGSNPQGWVTKLYQHVLHRNPARAEVDHWIRQMRAGQSRYSVAMGFLLSTEHLTTVVNGYYRDLLGRGIDPVGRAHWVWLIQTGTRVEEIIGGIVASDEYFSKG